MKSLICITTCKRINELKKSILPYIHFCHQSNDYHFLISLDGTEKEYLDFCEKYDIPLLYSEEREGVGLSKNRVLTNFSDYRYYFFIEDDVELYDSKVFDIHIELHKETGIHHFGCGARKIKETLNTKLGIVDCSMFGGAHFNFFTNESLKICGGWHTAFSKYKRYGHTEHSYRFYYNSLNPAPFCVFNKLNDFIILNDPPHVVNIQISHNENQLIEEEQKMIDSRQNYFPITTLSKFEFNNKNISVNLLNPDLKKQRYYLLRGINKIKARGNFFLHKFNISKNPLFLLLSAILYPNNNALKHYLKSKIGL